MSEDTHQSNTTTLLTPKAIADKLGSAREAGDGYMCRCPVHTDNRASLWIAPGRNGGLVAKCHAGCDTATVKAVLKDMDLWPSERGRTPSQDEYELESQYRYVNAQGQYVFTKRRLRHREDGSKMFPQCIERAGQTDLNRLPKETEKPLFMADKVAAASGPIVVVEGEKDVLSLTSYGETATCHPDGAGGTWLPHHVALLKDKQVLLVPDNDDPGMVHMQRAARALWGVAKEIRLVELPGLAEKQDLSDWFYLYEKDIEDFWDVVNQTAPMASPTDMAGLDWRTLLINSGSEDARPTNCQANVALALKHAEELKGHVAKDTFTGEIVVLEGLPWDRSGMSYPRVLNFERDPGELAIWLGNNSLLHNLSGHVCEAALRQVSEENEIDSLAARLDELPEWDGTPRMDTWLQKYCGAKNNPEYLRAVGRKFLISAIRRAYAIHHPVKADHVLVLESWVQGIGKSQLCRVLAMDDDLLLVNPPLHGSVKDLGEVLQGKWICEIEEMHAARKAESDHLKAQISRTTDTYRAAYAKASVARNRRCVFVGTLNLRGDGSHLKDSTGNRRFWPVETDTIDLEALRADVEQLWAEAIVAWKAGEKAWLEGDEAKLAGLEQDSRYEVPEIQDDIEQYIYHKFDGAGWIEREAPLDRVFENDFFQAVYQMGRTERLTPNGRRLRHEFQSCMGRMGWRKAKDKIRDIMGTGEMRRGAWVSPDYPTTGGPGPGKPTGGDNDPKTGSQGSECSQNGQSGHAAPAKESAPTLAKRDHSGSTGGITQNPNALKDLDAKSSIVIPCSQSSKDFLETPEISGNRGYLTDNNSVSRKVCKMGPKTGAVGAGADLGAVSDGVVAGTASLDEILQPGGIVAFDFETTGLRADRDQCRLISLASTAGWCVVDLWKISSCWAAALSRLWSSGLGDCTLVAFNAAFERSWVCEALGEDVPVIHDAMLLMAAMFGGSWKLSEAVKMILGQDMDKQYQLYDWSQEDLSPEAIKYSGLDADLTLKLWAALGTQADVDQQRGYLTLLEALPAVLEMKSVGIPFNSEAHQEWVTQMETAQHELEAKLQELCPEVENWAAPSQREPWLKMNLPETILSSWPRTDKSKAMKWDDNVLKDQIHALRLLGDNTHLIDLFETYQELAHINKQLGTFGPALADKVEDGRLKCDLRISAAKTGRMSASKPNLQQIPRESDFRKLFQAEKLIVADYSQIEVRVGALLSGETKLFDLVKDGYDIHTAMAGLIHGKAPADVTSDERSGAKKVTFGIQYGQQSFGLSKTLGLTKEQAQGELDRWSSQFPKMSGQRRTWHVEAEKTGQLRTASGRTIRVGHDARFSVCSNYPVQGSAADVIYKALKHLVEIRKEKELEFKICLVVHDEIILEADPEHTETAKAALELAMIRGYLELFPGAPVDGLVDAKIVSTWAEGK